MQILQIMTVTLLVSYAASAKDQPLTHLTNQHIELSVKRRWSLPTLSVIWHFEANRTKIKIAQIEKNILTFHHPQFNNRLELSDDGEKLHMRNLKMEDAGEYVCTITLTNHEMHKESFNIVLYDPVPAPTIRHKLEEITNDLCNMTLHCSVPINKPHLFYSWKYRHKDSDYQLYNNTEDTIQLLLKPEFGDMEVMCIVHNPADQKNISIYVHHSCLGNAHSISFKKDLSRTHYILLMVMLIFVMLIIYLKILRGRRRKYTLSFIVGVLWIVRRFFRNHNLRKQSQTMA